MPDDDPVSQPWVAPSASGSQATVFRTHPLGLWYMQYPVSTCLGLGHNPPRQVGSFLLNVASPLNEGESLTGAQLLPFLAGTALNSDTLYPDPCTKSSPPMT